MSKLDVKDFIDGIGHYCKMKDGSLGFIAKKITTYNAGVPRVLHNYIGAPRSWEYTDTERTDDDAPESLKKTFNRAWNINDPYDADKSGVVKIYQRMPNGMRKKKAPTKPTKKDTPFVLAKKLKKYVGHYCRMPDGSLGFIAGSSYHNNVCILHNVDKDIDGWGINSRNIDEIKGVSHQFISDYKYGWHVATDDEAEEVRVKKILESSAAYKKAKKFLNKKQITEGVGHFCTMADGSEGYITRTKSGAILVLHNANAPCEGWSFDPSDYDSVKEDKEFCEKYHHGWWIHSDTDAEGVKVVKVLDTQPEQKCAESTKKSVLDLTVRELLEKIYEAIER